MFDKLRTQLHIVTLFSRHLKKCPSSGARKLSFQLFSFDGKLAIKDPQKKKKTRDRLKDSLFKKW